MTACDRAESIGAYALQALPAGEAAAVDAHLASCAPCRDELASLQPAIDALTTWPTDILRPPTSLHARLAQRIAADSGAAPVVPATPRWSAPPWEEVAPGISCKLLATDHARHRVSMLVRLAPDTNYPPHTHAGVEELHLLDGELWIDDRLLHPGDYNRAEPGTSDRRVYSATGCTCVLITSPRDVLR